MDSIASPLTVSPLPFWKRAVDVSCCLVALPLLAVVAFWTLIVTVIAAPGPIFFRQERIGYKGRRFHLYKFRTMHVSASVSLHQAHFSQLMKSNVPMQKLDARRDSRLIPGGWMLRASGLDELPQVINVLRGEMTIVGPRPCIPYEFDQYTPWQRNRLASVPGLTGLWQVSGKNRTTFDEMVQLDIAYGESLSLSKDLLIMLRTAPALLIQISDIRKARRGSGQLVPTRMAEPVNLTPAPSSSATFLTNSQNVVGGRTEEIRQLPVQPLASAAFTVASEGPTTMRRVEGTRSPV